MKILMIQTGGTIDKDYPRVMKGYAFEIGDPAAGRILERVRPSFEYRIVTLMRKDSLEITDEDRFQIYDLCRRAEEQYILITHGTDTMIETGLYLAAHRTVSDIENKTIILTGAMRPERFYDSDAAFHLGTACGAFEWAPAGVYVAMHGRIIPVQNADRYPDTGQFYRR